MDKPTLPTIILGRTLLKLRLEAGLTQEQLAKKCRFSPSKISLIENGKQPVDLFDVAGMCRLLDAPPELTSHLERMSIEADTPGWWESFSTYMVRAFSTFLELEQVCSELYVYESELVTGLLQTEQYVRAVNAPCPTLDEQGIEKAVALQATRQKRFWARNPLPKICIVMHESAVTRSICGPDGDAEQRKRILELAASPGVDIRVLPAKVGAHPSMKGSYTIMTSGIPEVSDVVYTEAITGATYEENEEAVSDCRTFFVATRELAIPVKEFFNDQ